MAKTTSKTLIRHKTVLETPSKTHRGGGFGKDPPAETKGVVLEKKIPKPPSKTLIRHVFWRGVLEGSFGYPFFVSQKPT